MRDRTFFLLVVGCFVSGLVLAFTVLITAGVGHRQPGTVALLSK